MKGKNNSKYSGPDISGTLLFKTIMDHSVVSIYFKDKDSRFFAANMTKAIQHGLKNPDEMIGKTDFDYFCDSDAKIFFDEEKLILETGNPIIEKFEESTGLDGVKRYVSTTKYPLRDENDKIIGIWGISRDISEYELVKEAL